jgi:hypothetical protein
VSDQRLSPETEVMIKELFEHVEKQNKIFTANLLGQMEDMFKDNDEIHPVQLLAMVLHRSARFHIGGYEFIFKGITDMTDDTELRGILMRNEFNNLDSIRNMVRDIENYLKDKYKKELNNGSFWKRFKERNNDSYRIP